MNKMKDIYSFYNSILNIANKNSEAVEKTVREITQEETEKVLDLSPSLDGFCKYLASQIKEKLEENGIKSYWIDLDDIASVDHVVLIAEYRAEDSIQRLLIDPSFSQFTKKENATLVSLDEWPSEKIKNKTIVNDLLETGVTPLTQERWQDYISSFSKEPIEADLDMLLLTTSLNKLPQDAKRRK